MNIGSASMTSVFDSGVVVKVCPECGAGMVEVDRCKENSALFIWYECSKKECDGQWLNKTRRGF